MNSKPVDWAYLRQTLEQRLNRPSGDTLFLEGDGDLEVRDMVRVIDLARGVRPGIPIVLLTPTLKRTLRNQCLNVER